VLPLLVIVVHAVNGMYERDEKLINKSTLDEAPAIFQAATLVAVLDLLFNCVLLDTTVDPAALVATWIGLVVIVTAGRVAARAVVRDIWPPERCLVVGDHVHGHRLARRLSEEPKVKVELAGVLALPDESGAAETHERLAAIVSARDVHRVVIVADAGAPQQELQTVQAAKALGVKVSVMPRVLEVLGSSATYDYIDGLTLLGLPRFGLSRASKLTKRSLDLVGSLLLLIAFLPVLGVIAAAVKLTSPGPVLFRQTRIGRGGEPFFMLKFRSMHDDADRLKDALRSRNEAEGLFKIADDPRITRVGRFLRRSSLDELPQLWNVLRGEMSMVGPRPLVPEEDGMIRGWHRRRLQLTPGMTGPWQVLGSARIPLREMVTIDYQYVGNWSLWGDIKIMVRTLGVILARGGR
jgi:exopolysaccharide biosynthesis polyprenyl glycosylphosphotransferase